MTLIENDHSEGHLATVIENQTSKLPSDLFLWTALGTMAVAALLKGSGSRHAALFVGQWAAPFLLMGLYNKLVKLQGHDQQHHEMEDSTTIYG